MATHGFAGLFVKLKDRSMVLDDRLKLLRFAWKSGDVFIPNKEQALIDLLGSYLLDKKKDQLSPEDVSSVWRCLHEVLHTRRVQATSCQGKELVVKQSLAKLMTESLAVEDKGRQSSLRSTVVGCCQAVIASPALAHLFTLDVMLSLMCSLLKTNGQEATEDTSLLLSIIVDKYIKGLKTAPSQNTILQTMCDKLLPVMVPLWSESPDACAQTVGQVFLAAFTHKDHQHSLDLFLQSSQSDDKLKKRAKMATHVFATFEKFLKGENAEKMVHYLCEIFNSYVCHKCHDGNLQKSFNMVVHLFHLIGLSKDSAALRGTVAPPAVLRGVNRLLEVVQAQDLYQVVAEEGSRQLAYYRHLAKVLVDIDCISSDWFSNFTILLQLNHHIVEPILKEILTSGWMGDKSKIPDEALDSLDTFLEELILTYNKLRQVPKVIGKLLDCLCCCHGDKPIPLTPRFFKSFGVMTQSLPQRAMVDIWKTFVQKVKETFIGENAQQSRQGHFQGVVSLLHHFMMNLRVADYSVTDITFQSVQELLVTMETDVFSPLLRQQLENKEVQEELVSTLYLCYSWGEVVAMLAQYKQYRASHLQTCDLVSNLQDLSYIHSYLNTDQWRRLHKKIRKGNNAAVLYVWDLLLVQKARAILLFKDTRDWSVAKDVMAAVLAFLEELTEAISMTIWSKSLADISSENLTVARWHLVTTSLGAMQGILTTDQLQAVARWVLKTHGSHVPAEKDSVTLGQITGDFLRSPWVRENAGLQSQLITAALATCRDCFTSPVPRPKKRKSSSGLASFLNLLDILTSQDLDWTQDSNSEVLERTQEAGKSLGAVLGATEGLQSIPALSTLNSCLQVLESVPLEEIESCDQIRCLTGLLSLLAVLNSCSYQSEKEAAGRGALRDRCVALCTVLLESCSSAKVFTVIDLEAYLSWLCKLSVRCDEAKHVSFHKRLLMVKVSCDAVMKLKDVEKLEKLVPWIKRIFSNMPEDVEEEELVGMLGLVCSLLQSVAMVLSRAYLREELQPVCRELYLALSNGLLSLPTRDESGADNNYRLAIMVNCFSSMVSVYFIQDNVKKMFETRFRSLLHWCCKVLRESATSTAALYEKMSALNFLYCISKFHTGVDAVYTQGIKLEICQLLVDVLKNSQSQTSPAQPQNTTQLQTRSVSGHSHEKQINQSQTISVSGRSQHGTDVKISNNKIDPISNGDKSDIKEKINRINSLLQNQTVVKEKVKPHNKQACKTTDGSADLDKGVMQFDAIIQWYNCLGFEDRLESSEGKLLLTLLHSVMAALLASLEVKEFERIVCGLVKDVHSDQLFTNLTTMRSSLYIWQHLLQLEFSDEQTEILKTSAKNMMLNFQCILQQLHHCRDEVVIMAIVVPILNTQRQILTMPQKFLHPHMNLLCLHSCAYAPLGGSTYFPVFHAVCNVLDALLVHHEKPVLESIPAYIGCAKKLLLSVVDQSDQDAVSHDSEVVDSLKGCAYQMERLFTLISTHKVDFGKVAMYVVADYVTAVQKVTLVPAIKRALVPAVYKMLDLCDRHAVAQLHTVLSHGVIDVFQLLYHEYTKFHKYTGKI